MSSDARCHIGRMKMDVAEKVGQNLGMVVWVLRTLLGGTLAVWALVRLLGGPAIYG
jgi:hypothetical protein